MKGWTCEPGDQWVWLEDGRYCANLSAWRRWLFDDAIGPEPGRPEPPNPPNAPVGTMGVQPVRRVVGPTESSDMRGQVDKPAESVPTQAESNHGVIIT